MDSSKNNSEGREQIYSRAKNIQLAFIVISIIIIVRIAVLQYSDRGYQLREESRNFKTFDQKRIAAVRGDVLSHDYRILSTTIPMFHIYMDLAAGGMTDTLFNSNVDSLAISLAGYFKDRPARQYRDSLISWRRQQKHYKRISPCRVNYIELQDIYKFPLYREGRNKGGIVLDTLFKREFPHGTLAKRTIGQVNKNSGAMVGLEGYFDPWLKGEDGTTAMQKVSGNFWVPIESPVNKDPINGSNVVSTIDIEVQDVAESMLREQLTKHDATWGTAVLMEVATGEIRAIANLSKQPSGSYLEDYNYAVGMNMEPGSTWKLVSMMALLDDAKTTLNETVETGNGTARVGITTVVDTKAHGTVSIEEAFSVSSNIGFAKLINKYYGTKPSRFVDYIKDRGIDAHFDMQLHGEVDPIVYSPKDRMWNGMTLTMMSYGYAVMMTPIHTLALYNAIAGGGKYVAPLFVKEIQRDGQTIEEFSAKVINPQIATPQTVKQLQECLEGVVNEGTARNILRNDNYRVAGKTGTAQVAKHGGYRHNGGRTYLATIVGYFPAENPIYSCIVAIETFRPDGSNKLYYGGSLAGPVFRAIADKVYSQAVDWGVDVATPELAARKRAAANVAPSPRREYIKAGSNEPLREVIDELGIKRTIPGGDYIVRDSVKNGFKGVNFEAEGVVPNVIGMGLSDALYLLEQRGMAVSVTGKGSVVSQSREAGAKYMAGDTISISLNL